MRQCKPFGISVTQTTGTIAEGILNVEEVISGWGLPEMVSWKSEF